MTRPVWAEISRENLLRNYRLLRQHAGAAHLLAIVKANAYGHGTERCAELLAAAGAAWLGVTSVEEGAAVRAVCPEARILVMGSVWGSSAEASIAHRLTPIVWDAFHLEALESAAREHGLGAAALPVHLEIDTGMSRQGVQLEGLPAFLDRLRAASSLRVEGVMTHFHSPEFLDRVANAAQLCKFVTALDTIAAHGIRPAWIHAGNSSTVLDGAAGLVELAGRYQAQAMLRPGLALYGYASRFVGAGPLQDKAEAAAHALQPVLSWKTRVISLRTIAAGETVGYCETFRATRPSRIALLSVGYADGLSRKLSNQGAVLIRGHRAPFAGRISMDICSVDVTGIPGVEIGDEAVVIGNQNGEQGKLSITAYDHADMAGTIPYEILCNIHSRVPRVIVE